MFTPKDGGHLDNSEVIAEEGMPCLTAVDFLIMQVELAKATVTGVNPEIILPYPLSVCFSVTDQCDRHCGHCMSASTMKSHPGLTHEQVKNLFDRLKKSGVSRIDIVGGEPFLRNDILDILQYAIHIDLMPTVTTHGGLLTEQTAVSLSKLGITVQVSLDGSQDENDKLRGRNSYSGALKAIQLLVAAGVPVRISCTIQRSNQNAVEHVLKVAKNFGATGVYVNLICSQGRANTMHDKISLTEDDESSLRRKIVLLSQEAGPNSQLLEMKKVGRGGVFISASGEFMSQAQFEEDRKCFGNALTDDIREMWRRTDTDHTSHLLQYLQHPSMYKPDMYSDIDR